MTKIQKLPADVIAQIAAGQVVDHPASIVKELLENAVDAKAQNIVVRLSEGGKQKIVVVDDGIGMTKDDLEIAVQSHTTSKLFKLEDLENITTFGFRGEALASIVQSADLTIQSKQKNQTLGAKISIENNKQIISEVGMNPGTIVSVEKLFTRIPARKKFLKSATTEFQNCLDICVAFALSHPSIGLQVFHNDKLICDYLPNQTLAQRSQLILGTQLHDFLLPVRFNLGRYQVEGLLGSPQAAHISQLQLLFVNDRLVHSLPITKTIRKVFGTLLPPGLQPPFILFISAEPELIDVNVHPRKEKVTFEEQEMVIDVVQQAVQKTLENASIQFRFSPATSFEFEDSGMDPGTAEILRRNVQQPWNVKNYFENEPILQIKKLYLLAESSAGILFVDQHAAHERILYEEFLESFQKEKKVGNIEALSKPVILELPIVDAEILEEQKSLFEQIGFVFTREQLTKFSFTAVPILFKKREFSRYIAEVLQDIKDGVPIDELDQVSHKAIAYLACRTAIKAGEILTQQERHNLIQKLLQTKSGYTCPHGRPVLVIMDTKDLAQLFHRIPASRKEK